MSLSDWTVVNPESAGLRSEPLCDLIEWLDGSGQANIHSILVVRHGRLLFEHYRPGEDECRGEPLGIMAHGLDSKHDLRSVTKSVISLLLGIALDRKLINGIDDSSHGDCQAIAARALICPFWGTSCEVLVIGRGASPQRTASVVPEHRAKFAKLVLADVINFAQLPSRNGSGIAACPEGQRGNLPICPQGISRKTVRPGRLGIDLWNLLRRQVLNLFRSFQRPELIRVCV
jgi:hypothetical protein